MHTRKKKLCARRFQKHNHTLHDKKPLESKEASTTNDRHLPNPPAPLRTPNQKSNGPSLRCSQVLELFLRWHNLVKIKITVRLHLLNRVFNCIQNSMCALLVHWVFFCNMAYLLFKLLFLFKEASELFSCQICKRYDRSRFRNVLGQLGIYSPFSCY